jgi:hypothetical protein
MNDRHHGKGPLPVEEEDLAPVMGRAGGEERPASLHHAPRPLTAGRLLVTLILAAPVATVLSAAALDLYAGLAPIGGPRPMATDEPAAVEPAPAAMGKPSAGIDIARLADVFEKSDRRIAAALETQAAALAKLAERKPDVVTVEAKAAAPTIMVVKVPTREVFDLAYEKKKILDMAGIDIDDPVTAADLFDDVTNRTVMKEVIRALDEIATHKDEPEVDSFLLSNVLTAKKHARDRLKKLK